MPRRTALIASLILVPTSAPTLDPTVARGPDAAITLPWQQATGLDQVSFFLGGWDVNVLSPDGAMRVGRARTAVYLALDGKALQADYYGLDPAGSAVFRGTTIRTWIPSTERFIVHWAMAEQEGYTYLIEEYRDGELHAEGHGIDQGGEFLERYRYFDLSDTTYSFEMSRSYDGGETWAPWANLRATKRADEGP